MFVRRVSCFLLVFINSSFGLLHAQEEEEDFDASKPTNFYTQLINNLEYISRPTGGNMFGYRGEILFAPSEAHLILGELPLLYNDRTEKFGLGDRNLVRVTRKVLITRHIVLITIWARRDTAVEVIVCQQFDVVAHLQCTTT